MNADMMRQLVGLSENSIFSIGDMFLAMCVTTLLVYLLSYIYRETHTGPNYSKTFITSLFIMSISTSMVMLIIGSNIARAFSLIGALSIIRFRTAVKDPRDTAFLFAGVVAGMGCGTGFYIPAVILTLFLSALLLILDKYEFGSKSTMQTVVKLTSNANDDLQGIETIFSKTFKSFHKINQIDDFSGSQVVHVYTGMPNSLDDLELFKDDISNHFKVEKLSIYQADQHAPF